MKEPALTDKNPNENTGNERTVNNPKAPGQAERVDPTTGGDGGGIDSADAAKR